MYEQTRAFPFPRITGVLDDGSDVLNTVRQRISFKNAVRFVNDPTIFGTNPCIENQITVGFINPDNELAWQLVGDNVKLQLLIVNDMCKSVPQNISKSHIKETTVYEASKVIPSTMKDIVMRTAYLLSVTHLYHPNVVNNEFINVCDETLFHKTIWITNIFKNKNYDDRKVILRNLRGLLTKKTRSFDEFVLFGEEDYLKKVPTDHDYIKTVKVERNLGVESISNIFQWVFNNYPKDTVALVVRQETTEMEFSTIRSVTRMPERGIACLNPFILPDIPDPRPELYHRGDPRAISGYVMRIDSDTDVSKSNMLSKCSLYSVNHHQIVMGEMMMRRYTVGNGSRQVGVCFPNLKNLVLDTETAQPVNGIICPEIPPISFYVNTSGFPGAPIHKITSDGFTVSKFPGLNGDSPLETRTLMNMTNKMANRNKWNKANHINDSNFDRKSVHYNIYNGQNVRFKRKSWFENKKMVSQDYWGNGVNTRDTGFVHGSEVLNDCVIIPKTDKTIIDQVCKILLLSDAKTVVLDVEAEEKSIFHLLNDKLHYRDFNKSNVFGGEKCMFVASHSSGQDLGFCPQVVRAANRKYHDTINVDIAMMKMLGEVNGIIIGNKWSKSILEIANELYPSFKWRIVETMNDIKPDDFANACFVIGTQDSNAWCGSMFVHNEHCKIIEIAYEHDTTSKLYHLARGVGADYSIIPLKNEPKKRCLARIRDNLKTYMNEN
jgi:hypothetical protein